MTFRDLPVNETFYFARDEKRCVCTKIGFKGAERMYRVSARVHLYYTVDDDSVKVVVWRPHELEDGPPHLKGPNDV